MLPDSLTVTWNFGNVLLGEYMGPQAKSFSCLWIELKISKCWILLSESGRYGVIPKSQVGNKSKKAFRRQLVHAQVMLYWTSPKRSIRNRQSIITLIIIIAHQKSFQYLRNAVPIGVIITGYLNSKLTDSQCDIKYKQNVHL